MSTYPRDNILAKIRKFWIQQVNEHPGRIWFLFLTTVILLFEPVGDEDATIRSFLVLIWFTVVIFWLIRLPKLVANWRHQRRTKRIGQAMAENLNKHVVQHSKEELYEHKLRSSRIAQGLADNLNKRVLEEAEMSEKKSARQFSAEELRQHKLRSRRMVQEMVDALNRNVGEEIRQREKETARKYSTVELAEHQRRVKRLGQAMAEGLNRRVLEKGNNQ